MTQYAALARLLELSNRAHDLQNQLNQVPLPLGLSPNDVGAGEEAWFEVVALHRVGKLQEEIDREARASLVTAWLGMPAAEE
jgi:hypothetical protein